MGPWHCALDVVHYIYNFLIDLVSKITNFVDSFSKINWLVPGEKASPDN